MKNSANILEVKDLSKSIRKKKIIHEVSFNVEKGKIVGLLGPNGAGKTTIMKMLVGLMSPNAGEVFINSASLNYQFTDAIASIGAIIENPEFYNYLSGYDNLMQYVRMAKIEITQKEIEEIVAMVHLEEHIQQKVKTYSLGMRQRLGVAQATLHKPKLLILDEPMNGLDPQGIHEFRTLIRSLADSGVSVLVSSHILSDMEQLCDSFLVLQKGVITHREETVALAASGEARILIETDNDPLALEIISAAFDCEISLDKKIIIKTKEDLRIELVNTLVEHKIGVLSIQKETSNLEEQFLQWTEKGGL